jgi:mannose-1-phosphate guanylyltransferase/mannose-6-phosphate isomerase
MSAKRNNQKKAQKPLGLILAGGQSKRLFPVSTPKPLLKVNGISLLEHAIRRLAGFDIYIVTNSEIARTIRKAFKRDGLKVPKFIIEPEGRDTAAAVGYGIRKAAKSHSWVAVLSADQWMPNDRGFSKFLSEVEKEIFLHPHSLFVAGSSAKNKKPSSHSQFGWILPGVKQLNSFAVEKFVEKPVGALLTKMRKAGGLINGGMFFGRCETFLKAYKTFYPEVLSATAKNYSKLKRLPIDRAIFEKYPHVRVAPLPMRWEDLGTWEDWFSNVGEKIGGGSRARKLQCKNVLVSSDNNFEISAFDLKDLAIIQSGQRLLVMPLSRTRDLKKFLESLD